MKKLTLLIRRIKYTKHRKLLAAVLMSFVIVGCGILGYMAHLYFAVTPQLAGADFNNLLPITSKILDRDGKLLYEVGGEIKREIAQSSEIPHLMKEATIAAEDRDFYVHPGINLKSIARASLANMRAGRVVEGGSTITQQLIKNTLLSSEKTVQRKAKEALAAVVLETQMTKDEILPAYLNSVSYGSNVLGVKKAAATFFGKELTQLNLTEVATLAALPQSPGRLSLYIGNRKELDRRRDEILEQMFSAGVITRAELEAAKTAQVDVKPIAHPIVAPHFSLMVRDRLIEVYGREKVEGGGLVVRTSLDSELQAHVEEAMKSERRRINSYGASNAGAVVLDPRTGEILALAGSFDYYDSKIDGEVNIATSLRQPGSSFKPIVYSALFTHTSYSPASILYDVSTCFERNYCPKNYSGTTSGPLPIRKTLAGSLNIPAVKATAIVGVDQVINTAERFGYTTLIDRDQYGLAQGLGAGEVKLLEHTAAFGTLGQAGNFNAAASILSVKDYADRELYEFKPAAQAAIPAEVAYDITNILTDNQARSFIFGANSPLAFSGRTVAAKTGTSQDWRDGWTMGYTTSRAVGVWTGNNNGRYMRYNADGVVTAAPLWRKIMLRAMEGQTYEEFQRPENMRLVAGEYLAEWQLTGVSSARLATRSERPSDPRWERPVQEYLKRKQEQEAAQQAAAIPPPADVGGAPDSDTTPPAGGGGSGRPPADTSQPIPLVIPPP